MFETLPGLIAGLQLHGDEVVSEVVAIPKLLISPDRQKTKRSGQGGPMRRFLIGPENSHLLDAFSFETKSSNRILSSPLLNPVIIYGPVGSGKTHFLECLKTIVGRRGEFISIDAGGFSAECSEAIKLDTLQAFRQRYSQVPILAFDNIDHLKSHPFSQNQLSVILESRIDQELPTILTAKKKPRSLNLDPRLTSRVSAGLALPLKNPSATTRYQLIKEIAANKELRISEDAIDTLAKSDNLSAHDLGRILTDLHANHRLENRFDPISADDVQHCCSRQTQSRTDPKQVIRETAKHFGLKVGDLTGTSRRKQNTHARAVAMFLIRKTTNLSYHDIGAHFSKRDRTTVMHACNRVDTLRETETHIREAVARLSDSF